MRERIGIIRFEELSERWQEARLSRGQATAALVVAELTKTMSPPPPHRMTGIDHT